MAGQMDVDQDDLIRMFMDMTGASIDLAREYLNASDWDVSVAVPSYFADMDEAPTGDDAPSSAAAPPEYTGPRTLDGRPAPQAVPTTSSASSSKRPQKKKGLATLSSLGGGPAHDHDDDDDDDDRDPSHRDTYAGGEKSGLAVQDPNRRSNTKRIINDLLSKAKSEHQRPEPSSSAGPSSSSVFRGSGQTLGGDGVESRVIPDPNAREPRAPPRPNAEAQERTLHLWRDGFSIDDGPLHRFDDPANASDLRMIQNGRAPLHLMNVRYDDPVNVQLEQHDENYRQLPKVYRPFGGEGRRLGSPVPGEASASLSAVINTPVAPNTGAGPSTAPSTSVDESQPTIMIRIQMLDGTRLPARFNTSQTVEDIYDFISRSSPGLQSGGWVLATTFPNKDHTDKSQVIGDMAEFKKGGTAVVKRV